MVFLVFNPAVFMIAFCFMESHISISYGTLKFIYSACKTVVLFFIQYVQYSHRQFE